MNQKQVQKKDRDLKKDLCYIALSLVIGGILIKDIIVIVIGIIGYFSLEHHS